MAWKEMKNEARVSYELYIDKYGGDKPRHSVKIDKGGGTVSWSTFSTEEDARNAIMLARSIQYQGIAMRIDRKIYSK